MRLFGKNPVFERLRSNPKSIQKIFIEEGFSEAAYVYKKAKQHGVAVMSIPKPRMDKLGRHVNAQGIMADVGNFEYMEYRDLLDQAIDKRVTLVFLDSITDPQNLGATLRSLGCFGRFAVIIPTHNAAEITEAVLRVASGGENYVPVALVGNLTNAIKAAKEQDFHILGTVAAGGTPLWEVKMPRRVGVVMGSEQKGIRDVVLNHVDTKVTIPMAMEQLSMNVSHAATIIAYEITRQKKGSAD